MLDRKFINEKVDQLSVFDIFDGDVSKTLARIKQMVYKHGQNVQLIVDEHNPMQVNVLKGRYETDTEYKERLHNIHNEKVEGIQFKKRQLMNNLIAEFGAQ